MSTIQEQLRRALAAKLAQKTEVVEAPVTQVTEQTPVLEPKYELEADEETQVCDYCGNTYPASEIRHNEEDDLYICPSCDEDVEDEPASVEEEVVPQPPEAPAVIEAVPDTLCPDCGKPLYFKKPCRVGMKEGYRVERHYHRGTWEKTEARKEARTAFYIAEKRDFVLDPAAIPEWIPPTATVKMDDWKTLLTVFKVADAIGDDEAQLKFTQDGVAYIAMDPSHICLVDMLVSGSDCSSYRINRDFHVTVRTEDVLKGFKDFDKDDTVTVKTDDGFKLRFESESGGFGVHIIDCTEEKVPMPKLNLEAKFTAEHKVFKKLLEKIARFSDHIEIISTREYVQFKGKSDNGETDEKWLRSDPKLLELDVRSFDQEYKGLYSISYLLDIMKATQGYDTVTVEYSNKMPLRITFGPAGTTLHYYLAPRFEG